MYGCIYFYCTKERYSMELLRKLQGHELSDEIGFYCIDGNEVPEYIQVIPSLLMFNNEGNELYVGQEIENILFGQDIQEERMTIIADNTNKDVGFPEIPENNENRDPSIFAIKMDDLKKPVARESDSFHPLNTNNDKITNNDLESYMAARSLLDKEIKK